VQLLIKIVS